MALKVVVPEIIPSRNIFVGEANAPVTLLMYGDYESEPCAKANEVIKKLLIEFEGKLKFTFRHFPQTQIHQKAMKAAEASMAAAQEGRFWEMHNKLYERRKHLGTVSLKEYAREVGVTNKKFLDELVNSKYSWHVRGDQIEAWDLGLRSVPVIYINGIRFEETLKYDNLKAAIEQQVKKNRRKKG